MHVPTPRFMQGCGTFAISAWATHIANAHAHGTSVFEYKRPLFLTIAVTFWSVRLAGYLFYRILQTQTDKCASLPLPGEWCSLISAS